MKMFLQIFATIHICEVIYLRTHPHTPQVTFMICQSVHFTSALTEYHRLNVNILKTNEGQRPGLKVSRG